MRRILFLCSRNKLRSPTAESIFSEYAGVEVDSAGLSQDAVCPLSVEQLAWADTVLVMEKSHLAQLNRKFGKHLKGKKVAALGIPDKFAFMDERLIELLKVRCAPHIPKK